MLEVAAMVQGAKAVVAILAAAMEVAMAEVATEVVAYMMNSSIRARCHSHTSARNTRSPQKPRTAACPEHCIHATPRSRWLLLG